MQELGSIKKGSGEVGAVEHCFEQVCALKVGAGQVRLVQARSSEIGNSKIRSAKIEPAEVQPAQTGLRQVRIVPSDRHEFHAPRPRLSKITCSSFGMFGPYQTYGQLCSAVELRPVKLSPCQAFDSV